VCRLFRSFFTSGGHSNIHPAALAFSVIVAFRRYNFLFNQKLEQQFFKMTKPIIAHTVQKVLYCLFKTDRPSTNILLEGISTIEDAGVGVVLLSS
jgi:hypothetical protein